MENPRDRNVRLMCIVHQELEKLWRNACISVNRTSYQERSKIQGKTKKKVGLDGGKRASRALTLVW